MPVPTLDLSSHPDGREQLHLAAGLLTGAGYADPETVDPGVALLCLAAAEQLRLLGVQAPRVVIDPAEVTQAVSDALTSLAALPDELFASTPVLDAAAYVRAARALLT